MFGPVLGGLIIEHFSWHWLFVVNVPFGLAAIALGARCLPVRARVPSGPLDARGLALTLLGVPLLVYGLAESGHAGGFGAAEVLVPALAGVVLLAAFAVHALRTPQPLLNVRLLGGRAFGAAALGTFCGGAVLFGAVLLPPLYFQGPRGESALTAGLLLIPQGVGSALAMPVAGRLADRHGGGQVAVAGLVLATLATVPLALVGATTSYWFLGAVLFVRGVGVASSMMPLMAGAYAQIRVTDIADATPQLNVLQRVGGSLGTAVLAVILARHLDEAGPGAQAAASAFGATFWWAVGITAAAIVPAVALARIERRDGRAVQRERDLALGTGQAVSDPRPAGAPAPSSRSARGPA